MTNLNPYRPGAGKMPPVLAGRQELLQPVFEDMMRIEEEGTSDQPYVFWGLRGLGKTVFLNEIAQQALKRNWLVVKVEARSDVYLIKQLVQELAITLKRYQPVDGQVASALKRALRVLKSFQLRFDPTGVLAVNLNLDSEEGYADSGDENRDFQDALEAVGIVARELGVGALIAVDELQEAGIQNLKTLNVSLHEIGQAIEPLPVVFIGAGLPTLPSTLAKANSYAERMYKFSEIDLLDDAAVTTALREPAQERGVIWSEAALKTVPEIRDAMVNTMWYKVGVFREEGQLQEAAKELSALEKEYEHCYVGDTSHVYNTAFEQYIELGNLLQVSHSIVQGAIARKESRGGHSRRDFPQRDDQNFLKHTLIFKKDGGYHTEYKDVVITKYQPKERKY